MPGRFGTAVIALCLLAAPCRASPLLLDGRAAPPLAAWSAFCRQAPAECAIDSSEAETVPATPELLATLQRVNRSVNRAILPVTDLQGRGVSDRWEYPSDGMGDCEDIQLLKRRQLVAAGVPRRAMPMTVVLDERGEGHAVLTVRTDREDLILDNKTDEIRRWDRTGYAFVQREAATETGWAFVELPARAVVAAAQD